MNEWKRKLLAFLHDPPHKPFRIAGHEDARGPLLRHLNLTEQEIDAWHHQPDWWAAAADRFPFPRADVCFVDWKVDGDLEFRHPLCGSRLIPPNQPRQRAAVPEKWLEDVVHGLPVGDAGWKEKFFRLWRLWPERAAREKNPLLAYLVADTRIPDHTLWHHNGLVSALEVTDQKPAFLLFQIGPVQEFIAQARKTQDLWSGSYLLSFLISKALATVALRCGPDVIIYPNLRGVPLLDWWWSQEAGLFPNDYFQLGRGRLHQNELLTPSLPNRFLALVPAGEDGRAIADKAAHAVRELWEAIADAVHADICAKLQSELGRGDFRHWGDHWKEQVARFPVVDWVLHEWLPEADSFNQANEKKMPPLFGGLENHPLRHAAAWRGMIPENHRESWHGKRNDAFVWALHYAATDWKFAARKNARTFANWTPLKPGTNSPPKDHLNARDEVLGGAEPKEFWDALRKAYDGADKGDFKGSQLYGAITIIKRLWSKAYLGHKLDWRHCRPDFESVQDVAGSRREVGFINRAIASEPSEELGKDDPKYYAVLCMDGDDMGQWVSGAKTPPLDQVLAGKKALPYFAENWKPFRTKRGDVEVEWVAAGEVVPAEDGLPEKRPVARPLSPGFHAALSEALSNFGLYCAGQVVEAFDGQLLYSGGDDVMAMLPAANALDCTLALQCAFHGELPADCSTQVREKMEFLFAFPAPGFIVCKRGSGDDEGLRPNWPLMVPGTRAAASVGIAIGHVHSPMQDTIQAARDAEATAKRVPGKGAFCLNILKRSGESASFAAQFKRGVADIWAELEKNDDQLSNRFPYRFLQIVRPLLARSGNNGDEGWESRWSSELIGSVEAELRHVHYQQNQSGGPAERKRVIARDKASHWMRQLVGEAKAADEADFQPALSPRAFVHFWMAWAFVKRLADQPENEP